MATTPLFYSEEEVFNLAIAYFTAQFPSRAIHPKSFLGHVARALAQLVGALQQAQQQAYYDGIPAYQVDYDGVIRSRCSSEALDNWAFVFGLVSNRGASIFGRNGAVAASGGLGNVVGVAGTVVPAGTQLTDPSGQVVVQLAVGVTVPGGGSIAGTFNAITTGLASNLPPGTVLRWQSPPAGLQPTVTLGTGLSGGYDTESDLDLVARLIRRLQNPPEGGTAADYRTWAEAATDSNGKSLGISRAYVYPLRNGIGSVDVVITQAGSGQGRKPTSAVTACQAYLDARRIATDTVRVILPNFPAGQSLKIRVRIQPGAPAYAFDWDASVLTLTLVSYAGTSLVVSGSSPPIPLKNAVDAGAKPRVQVGITGFPVPRQRRVLSYAVDTPMAGQCTLTLETALDAGGLSHTTGYAGSGAVEAVAQAVVDHINALGPSRLSGSADPRDIWNDVVTIGGIAGAALSVRDSSGTPLVAYSSSVGVGVGVTIAVGAGAFSGADFLLFDNTPGAGPQLPDPILVLVTA